MKDCIIAITILLATSLTSTPLFAKPISKIKASLQAGIERDSNVLKTFDSNISDELTRVLLKLKGVKIWNNNSLRVHYYGGGKKFFTKTEQDTLTQQFTSKYNLSCKKNSFSLKGKFKWQDERDKRDTSNIDTNEDYILFNAAGFFSRKLNSTVRLNLSAEIEDFIYGPDKPFDYLRHRYLIALRRKISPSFSVGINYALSQQRFTSQDRTDTMQEAGTEMQFSRQFIFNVAYTFQHNSSNSDFYDYNNHKLTAVLTAPIEISNYTIILNILGILQIRNFPALYKVDEEGERYLLTGAEAENFNSIIAKLSGKIVKNLFWEFKFSRYSNETASRGGDFSRSLIYGGMRFDI